MHKLAVLRSPPMIQELMRRLEEASIEAVATTERNVLELHAGGVLSVSIWIADPAQLGAASEILRHVSADVSAERTHHRCPACGYDLRGHTGRTHCPECGLDLTVQAPDIECPHCRELVPAGFEICWNCGGEVGGEK